MAIQDILGIGLQQIGAGRLQKGLAKPIKDIDTFLGRIDRIGQTFLPKTPPANEYARQNVLQAIQNRKDPLLTVDWIGIVQDPVGVTNSPNVPWSYIDEIQTPSIRVGSEPVFRNGIVKKYATSYEVDNANLKIYTDTTGQAFNFCNAWTRSTRRQDGLWNLASQYKKDIIIFILDATRSVVVDIRLIGCFPNSWNSYQLEAGGSNALITTLDLSVDDFYINVDSDGSSAKNELTKFLAPARNMLGNISNKLDSVIGNVAKTQTFVSQVRSLL